MFSQVILQPSQGGQPNQVQPIGRRQLEVLVAHPNLLQAGNVGVLYLFCGLRMNETPRRVDKIFLMGTCGVLYFLSKPTWAMLCSKVVYLMYCTRAVTGVSSAARNRGSSLQPAILRASASTKSTKSDGVTEACIAASVKLAYKYSFFGALHSMHFDSSSF